MQLSFYIFILDLTDLVNQADEFNAKNSDYDVIKEYIQASGNCQEILQFVKEIATADSQKVSSTMIHKW